MKRSIFPSNETIESYIYTNQSTNRLLLPKNTNSKRSVMIYWILSFFNIKSITSSEKEKLAFIYSNFIENFNFECFQEKILLIVALNIIKKSDFVKCDLNFDDLINQLTNNNENLNKIIKKNYSQTEIFVLNLLKWNINILTIIDIVNYLIERHSIVIDVNDIIYLNLFSKAALLYFDLTKLNLYKASIIVITVYMIYLTLMNKNISEQNGVKMLIQSLVLGNNDDNLDILDGVKGFVVFLKVEFDLKGLEIEFVNNFICDLMKSDDLNELMIRNQCYKQLYMKDSRRKKFFSKRKNTLMNKKVIKVVKRMRMRTRKTLMIK